MSTRCKGCGRDVEWAITSEGKWMPVDKVPVEGGNVLLEPRIGQPPVATVLKAAEALNAASEGKKLRKSHFATCPDAAKHRRKR